MKPKVWMIAASALLFVAGLPGREPAGPPQKAPLKDPSAPSTSRADDANGGRRADKRYEEMLDRMQAAVEEVAELYGNPAFLQVFTNDAARAVDLKRRLIAEQTGEEVRLQLASLQKRREDLAADIALKEREAARLAAKLERQRAALDGLAAAVEQARRAVEDTAK